MPSFSYPSPLTTRFPRSTATSPSTHPLFQQLSSFDLSSHDHQIPSFNSYLTAVIMMYAVGYPIGHTAVLGAFSKAQKRGRQGALMGWFASAGSFARVVLPVISGYLGRYNDTMQPSTWLMVILLTLSPCLPHPLPPSLSHSLSVYPFRAMGRWQSHQPGGDTAHYLLHRSHSHAENTQRRCDNMPS